MTLEGKLVAGGGRPTGFDYMRVVLAMLIIAWHSCVICYGLAAQTALALGPSRPFWAMLLPMFFALSGFLVAGSMERSKTLISFLGLRGLRLFPALAVESALSLFLLGGIFTDLPAVHYFSSVETWSYLLNIVGLIHYTLPGVFDKNPIVYVNLQLWTLPWEIKCYAVASLIFLLGAFGSKWRLIVSLIVLQVFATWSFFHDNDPDVGILKNWGLVLAFAFGFAFYRFRTTILFRLDLGIVAGGAAMVMLSFRETEVFAPLAAAYFTVYLGLLTPKLVWPLTAGDYSYPMFLYGFPIQQAVLALLPWSGHWWMNLALSALPICAVSAFSWHCIEKPAQSLRKLVFATEKALLRVYDPLASALVARLPPGLRSRWTRSGDPAPVESAPTPSTHH